ncbi:zinc ribbon domain-containing protein [Nocardioides cavernaquae]|uniref:zinc ribbon domain-containing protein n=1 Tax=Nocardioides cavernaquae TaxID=2321396 RepID=UPI0015FF0E85|nr:zinc ribbon domain-containing protein [Nocardioides cavernaquae]
MDVTTMKYCQRCGAELDLGRFCINCGAPVDPSTPAPAPVEAPPVYGPATTYVLPDRTVPPAATPRVGSAGRRRSPGRASGPGAAVWIFLLVGLLLAILLGSCLALRTSGSDGSAAPTAEPSKTPEPSDPTSATPTGVETGRAGTDLAVVAKASAPRPMSASRDLAGNRVSYPASNMLDNDRATAYRLTGDGSGTVIRFDLGKDRVVTAVGLINGYAKVDGATDWYPRNRRILSVEWRFDDGTVVTQRLVDTPDLQTIQVDPETTGSVQLRIVDVSRPGRRGGKNTTAISDVLLLGS